MLSSARRVTKNGGASRDISELEGGTAMKPMNVFPMIILLIAVILVVIWLRPH